MSNLSNFQTDHLVMLVGTNPLPNYVAARLLCPTGRVHLLCSADTQNQAQQLEKQLANASIRPLIKESEPQDIFQAARTVIVGIPAHETVGLHYTGGTKAMSVHAYRAIEQTRPGVIFSYLDARELRLVIDGGMDDGRDDYYPVGQRVKITVPEIVRLHKISLKEPKQQPILIDVAQAIKNTIESEQGADWREWLKKQRCVTNGFDKKKGNDIKKILAPDEASFPLLFQAFAQLGAPSSATLEDWAKVAGFKTSKDDIPKFAKWLEGEWLESIVLQALLKIQDECGLRDCGMDYESLSEDKKFQFDVAATRGYQLFALSCTTSQDNDLCKSKLFEAYVRAEQMGGSEARVALVCYHKNPAGLLQKFLNEWSYPRQSVAVFGAEDLKGLPGCLTEWINSERSQ